MAVGQHSQAQVGEEQELPPPTATVWWTIERRHQAALGQASHLLIQSGTAAVPRKR